MIDWGGGRMAARQADRGLAHELYSSLLTRDEARASRNGAAAVEDLGPEIELLRILIRRAVGDGCDLETVSRAVGRLGHLLRLQRVVKGAAAKSLDEALGRVLDEVASELGL